MRFQVDSSSFRCVAKAAGAMADGSVPSGSSTAFRSADAAIALISLLSRSTIDAGVPAGANTPTQMSTSNPGATEASGGRPGNAAWGFPDVTAIAFTLPLAMSGAIVL